MCSTGAAGKWHREHRDPLRQVPQLTAIKNQGKGKDMARSHPLRQVGYLFGVNSVAQAQTGVTVKKKKKRLISAGDKEGQEGS